jgi:hypothetical protein
VEPTASGVVAALTAPIEKLIDAVDKATGTLYQPTQVVRMANAQAKADQIKATSDIDIAELRERATIRTGHIELRRQQNIESILEKTVRKLESKKSGSSPNPDWLIQFFESCKDISDVELQELWSTILADETQKPGAYRARTLEFLRYISKDDAILFNKVASLVITFGGVSCLLWDLRARTFYNEMGIRPQELQRIRKAGFVTVQEDYRLYRDQKHEINYFHHVIQLDAKRHGESTTSLLLLSSEAEELVKLTNRAYIQNFTTVIVNAFKNKKQMVIYVDNVRFFSNSNTEKLVKLVEKPDVSPLTQADIER